VKIKLKQIKTPIIYSVTFIVIIGVFFAFMNSLIDIKQIEQQSIATIQRAFPNVDVQFEEIDYKLSTSLKIMGKNLRFKIKKRQRDTDIETLLEVKRFEVKIPLVAMMMNGGNIRFRGYDVEINYEDYPKRNNWNFVFSDHALYKELEVLSFITNSRLNFNLYNSKVSYKLRKSKPKEVSFEKIVIKDLNSTSTTAYELLTHMDYEVAKNKKISAKVLGVGQINLKKYLETNEVETELLTHLMNIKYSKTDAEIPHLKNKIIYSQKKGEPSVFAIETDLSQVLTIKTEGTLSGNQVEFSNTIMELSLANLKKVLTSAQQKKLAIFEFNKSKLSAAGSASYNLKTDEFKPNFDFSIDKEFNVSLPYSVSFLNTLKGEWKGNLFSIALNSGIFDGTLTTQIKSKLKFLPKKNEFLGPYSHETSLIASAIKLKKVNFRDMIYKFEKKEPGQISRKKSKLWQGKVKLDFRQININGEEVNLTGNLIVTPQTIKSSKIKYKVGDGSGIINYEFELDETRIKNHKISATYDKTPFKVVKIFLPSYFDNYEGLLSGNLRAESLNDSVKRDLEGRIDFTISDGEFRALNFNDYVKSFINDKNVFKFKVKKRDAILSELKSDNKFRKLALKASFNNGFSKLNKIEFLSDDRAMKVNGSGELYLNEDLQDQTSSLFLRLTYTSPILSKMLKDGIGTNSIPLKFEGEGLDLSAQPNYTLEKLINEVLKEKSQKFIDSEKLKSLLQSEKIQINPKLLRKM
jgi:hypothetical protein